MYPYLIACMLHLSLNSFVLKKLCRTITLCQIVKIWSICRVLMRSVSVSIQSNWKMLILISVSMCRSACSACNSNSDDHGHIFHRHFNNKLKVNIRCTWFNWKEDLSSFNSYVYLHTYIYNMPARNALLPNAILIQMILYIFSVSAL